MNIKKLLTGVIATALLSGGVAFYQPWRTGAPEAVPTPPPATAPATAEAPSRVFQVSSRATSFFARGPAGELMPETNAGRHYYRAGEGVYTYARQLDQRRTALVVMDPWADAGAPALNKHFDPVYRNRLLPLVQKSLRLGIPVIVLTNDPSKISDSYGSEVYPELKALAEQKAVQLLYHQSQTSQSFASYLKSNAIDTLVYAGFASNMCVIGRPLGIIPMQLQGFRLFFVPEASAAVEFGDSWSTGQLHKAATTFISQSFAELLDLGELMSLPEDAAVARKQ